MDSNLYQLSRLKSRVFEFRFTARIKPTLIVVVFGSILDDDRSVGYHEVGPIADQEKVNSKEGVKKMDVVGWAIGFVIALFALFLLGAWVQVRIRLP